MSEPKSEQSGPEKSRPAFTLPISTDEHGNRTVEHNGHVFNMADDGTMRVRLDAIERIAIDNLLMLKNYQISHMDGRTMHFVQFHNGGTGEITFTSDGQMEVFEVHDVNVLISPDGRTVTLGCQLNLVTQPHGSV